MMRVLGVVALLAGCTPTEGVRGLRPQVDLSPVGCGYKWFQSGYGPTVQIPCNQDRAPLSEEHKALAREHAWEIAERRCPDACASVEIDDSVAVEDRTPNGVCRGGYAYFSARVIFQCGE